MSDPKDDSTGEFEVSVDGGEWHTVTLPRPISPVSVSGRRFARAWAAVATAASDDEERPALYRRVLVERFIEGLQLLATDSYWLAKVWMPFELGTPAPLLEELPAESIVVADVDLRLRDLMRYVAKKTAKDDADHPDIDVTLTPGIDYDDDTPTLDPTLAEPQIAVDIVGERLLVRMSEFGYPSWRKLMRQPDGATQSVAFGPTTLSRLAAAVNASGATSVHFDFTTDPLAPVRWSAEHLGVDLVGLIMPMRPADEARS